MVIGGVLLCLVRVVEISSNVRKSVCCMLAYLSKSFHHTRQRTREVAILDGQAEFGTAAFK